MKDLYEALGISRSASAGEIKKAYREAAFRYHPDRNPDDSHAEERFKEISAAYAVLGDSEKRARYDRYGSADSYAQAEQRAYSGGSGQDPFNGDFWEWYAATMRQAQSEQNEYRRSQQNRQPTKKEAFASMIRYGLILGAGLFFFRFSWILLPIGPLLSIAAIINGAIGLTRSIQILLGGK